MTTIKGNPQNKIRIIFLKEVPHTPTLYQNHYNRGNLTEEQPRSLKGNKINHTSIAYLSSIIQDEHLQTQQSMIPLRQLDEPTQTIDKMDYFYRTNKKSNRYLSCLLQAPGSIQHEQHSKTQGIDKMLRRKRILPIDKIMQRRKNITFSLKNKKQLNQDFKDFVFKQSINSHTVEINAHPQDKETIILSKRNKLDKNYSKLRGEAQRHKGKRIMQDLKQIQQGLRIPISNKKIKAQSQDPAYAIAFKRLSGDMPRLSRFDWSNLDDNSYQLVKN